MSDYRGQGMRQDFAIGAGPDIAVREETLRREWVANVMLPALRNYSKIVGEKWVELSGLMEYMQEIGCEEPPHAKGIQTTTDIVSRASSSVDFATKYVAKLKMHEWRKHPVRGRKMQFTITYVREWVPGCVSS